MTAPPTLRAALYWVPSQSDTLLAAGNIWLGRDPEHAVALTQPAIENIAEITASPRVYGFHATLRPPMCLATGWPEFLAAAALIARWIEPFDLPPLAVTDLGGFLALRETSPCAALQALADACVVGTDRHRLAASPAELARRRAAGLTAAQEELLLRWGYPYVMGCWRFHMTLSRRLGAPEMARLRAPAEAHFASALKVPRKVSEIALFTQRGDDPFLIAERLKLGA